MKLLSRRDAIRKVSAILWAAASGCLLQTLVSGCSSQEPDQRLINEISTKIVPVDLDDIKITVIYDNVPYDNRLTSDWGFSCCVEGLDKTILFDTGGHDKTFMDNMSRVQIDPHRIDELVISHDHPDHIGGATAFLKSNADINISLVKSFRGSFKKSLRNLGASLTEIKQPSLISRNCLSTGELKSFKRSEQSLVILTNRGLIVITGCAHPGVIKIVERAKRLTGKRVLLLMGGFHLLHENSSSSKKIAIMLKDQGVRCIAPTHCSGSETAGSFAEVFGNNYIDSGVGKIITGKDYS